MDAYDIHQKIQALWQSLATPASGASVKKSFPEVPVYVLIDNKLVTVQEVYLDSGKIILRVDNE